MTMAVKMMMMLLLVVTGSSVTTVTAFQTIPTCPTATISKNTPSTAPSSTNTQLHVWFPDEGMEAARGSFPLWLFGAAGSGGVARKAIPDLLDDFKDIATLKGLGPTKATGGGDDATLGLSPLLGYPEDVAIADIESIVNLKLNIDQIVTQYPIENNFLSEMGYLTLEAYERANSQNNPLATRVVFDSFQKSKVVEPQLAQACIDSYQANANDGYKVIIQNLNFARFKQFSAVFALLFLLGLADLATATDAYHGWFPDWPGGKNFPWQVLTAEGNPFTIPQYWVGDI